MTYQPTKEDIQYLRSSIEEDQKKGIDATSKIMAYDQALGMPKGSNYMPTELDSRMMDRSVVGVPGSGVTYATPSNIRRDISGETEDRTTKDLKDFLPGLANPWINAANMIPNVHLKQYHQENPHSMASVAGKLAGTIGPFMVPEVGISSLASQVPKAARGLELGEEAIKEAEKAAQGFIHPSPLRSAVSGALTGYATSPTDRKLNAAVGGVSAGILHGAGGIVGLLANKLPIGAKIQKAAALYKPSLSENPSDAARKASVKIADNYIWDKRYGKKLYDEATKSADERGIKFDAKSFPSYTEQYNRLSNDNRLPDRVITPKNLVPKDNAEGITPTSVHKKKSDLLALGRSTGSGFDKKSYNNLANSLQRDYYSKIDPVDENLGHAYSKANEYWKNNIIDTYTEHGAFKKMRNVLKEIPGGLDNEDKNLFQLNWHGKSPSSLINELVPKKKSDGMALFDSFKNDLMKGNHEETRTLAKDLMFSKHATHLNGPLHPGEIETPNYKFNIYDFLTHYDNLGESQKSFLFDPEEVKTLNIMASHKDKLKKPSELSRLIKKGLGASMGYIIGSHTLGSPVGKALSVPIGAALAEPAEQAAAAMTKGFLPDNTEDILKTMKPYKASFKTTRLPASASIGGIQTLMGNDNANQ